MHNQVIRNPVTNWTNGSQILKAELASFDLNLAQAVNGAAGGCWAPTNQSVFGGASMSVIGPVVVTYGGGLSSTSVGGITFQGQAWPQYASGHVGTTQQRLYALSDGYALNDPSVGSFFYRQVGAVAGPPVVPNYDITVPWPRSPFWRQRFSDTGVQALAPFINFSDGAGYRPMQWRSPIRAFDGSTLTNVTVCFRVTTPPAQVPGIMPAVRIVRIDPQGNVTALTSTASGADSNGYVYLPKPTSPAAWYNQGQAQRVSIPCDQNNAISITGYAYAVEISEFAPTTGYPWQLVCKASVHASTFFQPQILSGVKTIDGVTVGNFNERVLVAGGVIPTTWTAFAQFSQGALTSGASFVFRCIQAGTTASSAPTWANYATVGATVTDGTVVWRGVYPTAANMVSDYVGNGIWIASAGNWQRAPDMTLPSDFTQGMLVPIAECLNGGANNGALGSGVAQLSSNVTSWDPTSTPLQFVMRGPDEDEATATSGTEMFGHGLVWHTAGALYSGLTQQTFD